MSPVRHSLVLTLAILTTAAGHAQAQLVPAPDGRAHFTQNGASTTIVCDWRPVEIDANRVSLKVVGPCRRVIVAGNHNDVSSQVRAGGIVEITGEHNDVWVHQVSRGRMPVLLNYGQSNTFHPGRPGGF